MSMLSRRALLASAALPLAAKPALRVGCQTNAWRIDAANPANLLAVLKAIRGLGYAGFETSYRNLDGKPDSYRDEIARIGLAFIGIHIWQPKYGPDGIASPDLIQRVAALGQRFGAAHLILSGASTAETDVGTKAAALNRAAEVAGRYGLTLAYHNHAPEFAERQMPLLLRETAGAGIRFIVDLGHAWLGAGDFSDFFFANAPRIAGVHLRDFTSRDPGSQVVLGQGQLNYGDFATRLLKSNWSGWIINEEERLQDVKPGETAVRPARAQVKKLFGV